MSRNGDCPSWTFSAVAASRRTRRRRWCSRTRDEQAVAVGERGGARRQHAYARDAREHDAPSASGIATRSRRALAPWRRPRRPALAGRGRAPRRRRDRSVEQVRRPSGSDPPGSTASSRRMIASTPAGSPGSPPRRHQDPVDDLRDDERDVVAAEGAGRSPSRTSRCRARTGRFARRAAARAPARATCTRRCRCDRRSRQVDARRQRRVEGRSSTRPVSLAEVGRRELGEAEVEHLQVVAVGDEEVGRLDVAVDDAAAVGGVERVGACRASAMTRSGGIGPSISCRTVAPRAVPWR
jgi:hypothetical protein